MHSLQLMQEGMSEADASVPIHIFFNRIIYKPDLLKIPMLLRGSADELRRGSLLPRSSANGIRGLRTSVARMLQT